MSYIFYTFGIRFYYFVIQLATIFGNKKAKLWINGRKNWRDQLKNNTKHWTDSAWIHASSLGEFEQARPLIETLKKQHPNLKILLSFFSPSGYELRKNYEFADFTLYLPLDTKKNAQQFFNIIQPKFSIFTKYDLWFHFISEAKTVNSKLILIAAIYESRSKYFKFPLRSVYKRMFEAFDAIFTQNEASKVVLEEQNLQNTEIQIAGDPRIDRVGNIAMNFEPIPAIKKFIGDEFCVIFGSSWQKDEKIFFEILQKCQSLEIKWIIAPHVIKSEKISETCKQFSDHAKYSEFIKNTKIEAKILWIDNIGMLNRLYHYANLAYIGNGFGDGIHNTLEPAAHTCPIFFGPNYKMFQEAVNMVQLGGAFSINSAEDLFQHLKDCYENQEKCREIGEINKSYITQNLGATEKIYNFIHENYLNP